MTANSASPSAAASTRPVARSVSSRSRPSAKVSWLTPRISRPGPARTGGRPAGRAGTGHAVPVVLLEVGEEAVDDPLLARVVGERLLDDPGGEVDGEPAHLGAQLDHGLLTLGLHLLLRGRGDARRVLLRALAQLGADLRRLGTGVLADPGRLRAGALELPLVLLARLLRPRAWASSALAMPPSMAAVRSAKICSSRGTT